MSLPYYKRFPRDFLDGTIGLSLETKGAYAIVLDLIYMRDGRLADDARYIAGQLGCSVRKWTSIRDELIARGKLVCELGFISNFRADYLLEDMRKYQDKQSENRTGTKKNNDLPKRSSNQSQPQSDTNSEEAAVVGADAVANDLPSTVPIPVQATVDDWPNGDARHHGELLVDLARTVHLDPSRQPGLVTTAGQLHAWRRDGASWEHDVVPVVTSIAQKQRRAIASWKFFAAAIAQSIADNRAALSIPEAQTHAAQADAHRPSPKLTAKRANLNRHFASAEPGADLMAARGSY